MSIDYKQALGYATMVREINLTLEGLTFQAYADVTPDLFLDDSTDTQAAALAIADDHLLILFRGTVELNDWKTNVQFSRKLFEIRGPTSLGSPSPSSTPAPPLEHIRPVDPRKDLSSVAPQARMHEGFTEAYMSIQDQLHRYVLFQNRRKLTFIGHSLGGALATLCAIDFQLSYEDRFDVELFTFGSPRVGNPEFRTLVNQHIPNSYRIVNGLDAVPGLPPRWSGYRHVDRVYRIGRRLTWRILSARVYDHYTDAYIEGLKKRVGKK